MKRTLLVLILTLLPLTSASTYTLGNHEVSFNLSQNFTADLQVPVVTAGGKEYDFNINGSDGFAILSVIELKYPNYAGQLLQNQMDNDIKQINEVGFEDVKYASTTFRGYNAFEKSVPAQKVWKDGGIVGISSDYRTLFYQIDEWTYMGIQVNDNKTMYQELLDTIQVTRAPEKAVSHESYVGPTSAYAGVGQGAKSGLEDKNILNNLGK
jgi:hypothetical protein